jgi:hypothetical protein
MQAESNDVKTTSTKAPMRRALRADLQWTGE